MIRSLTTAMVVLIMAAGCSSSSGRPDGGSGPNCFATTGTNCLCSSTAANSLSACSSTSVASTDQGYCCNGGGYCSCFRIACVSLGSIGYCECGSPIDDTSQRVDTCLPSGGSCCLDTGLYPYSCHCTSAAPSCPSGQMQVASCSLADVMGCDATSPSLVDSCK